MVGGGACAAGGAPTLGCGEGAGWSSPREHPSITGEVETTRLTISTVGSKPFQRFLCNVIVLDHFGNPFLSNLRCRVTT